jgi:hypothetical protein
MILRQSQAAFGSSKTGFHECFDDLTATVAAGLQRDENLACDKIVTEYDL